MQHRIIEMVNGRPRSRLVSEEELKVLNTPKGLREGNSPKGTPRPGKYDVDVRRYGSRFGVRNAVFGNK